MLTVEPGATLTIRPGADVRFAPEAGLTVLGVLRAEGTADRPILMGPAGDGQAQWQGINLAGGPVPSSLVSCRIARAKALGIGAGEQRIAGCEISGGVVGVSVTGDTTRAVLTGNRIFDQSEGGIQCATAATGLVTDNVIERCGNRCISASQGAAVEIRGNRLAACASGIEINQSPPRISGNTVTDCERGIALNAVERGEPVRDNRLERNRIGILSQQFSSGEIFGNTVRGNGDGIVCFMGAAPLIRNNDILDNERGIFCNQISTPEISANTIAGNRRGVVLHLSSYALVRGNNISGGEVLMELMNMSSDWERRVGGKPRRGLQQRNRVRTEQGREVPQPGLEDGLALEVTAVAADGNWWGEAATREMEAKGPAANIAGLVDYYDVPTRTYEGFEGEYVQDRIAYAPWAKAPIAGAGVPAPAAPPAGRIP
jgi:parallel beta-helix repeat protein